VPLCPACANKKYSMHKAVCNTDEFAVTQQQDIV